MTDKERDFLLITIAEHVIRDKEDELHKTCNSNTTYNGFVRAKEIIEKYKKNNGGV